MIDKRVATLSEAFEGVKDGSVVLIGGFGSVGQPDGLIHGLIDYGATDLTIVMNNSGGAGTSVSKLMELGRVRKIVCSFPRQRDPGAFDALYTAGKIELEIVPQGTLAERIRAAGAGVPAFYTATGVGTPLADGKEVRTINGRDYLLEYALNADIALVEAWHGDRWGNLSYVGAGQNFNPVMATAAKLTIAQVHKIVELGEIDPIDVRTQGIFVDRLIELPSRTEEERG